MVNCIKYKMNFEELIRNNRSYRRFYQEEIIPYETLVKLVDYARLSASSGNIQSLKFSLFNEEEKNEIIFRHLKWASYLKNWPGPAIGERPSAYILILTDTDIHTTIETDVGIAAQSMLLGAVSFGYGGCMIASVSRSNLSKELKIPDKFQIPLVIALGKPKEKILIEDVSQDEKIEYWRDENNLHHVPKRKLNDLIINF